MNRLVESCWQTWIGVSWENKVSQETVLSQVAAKAIDLSPILKKIETRICVIKIHRNKWQFCQGQARRNCRNEVKGTNKSTMISARYEVENQVSQRRRGLAKYEQDDDDQEEVVQVRHEAQEEDAKCGFTMGMMVPKWNLKY